MGLLELIKEKRAELKELERQYAEETPFCCTKDCILYSEMSHCNCRRVLVEDCPNYTIEPEEEISDEEKAEMAEQKDTDERIDQIMEDKNNE